MHGALIARRERRKKGSSLTEALEEEIHVSEVLA
jgi:hypothetical protein